MPVVSPLLKYTSKMFFYEISYPPGYTVREADPYSVVIDGAGGGIAVLVDRLPVEQTARSYFDSISAGKRQQLPTWTSSSETEIKENDETIGYRFDYSNKVGDKNWIGKGMVLKKGGFGFYVAFTTPESDWEAKKTMAAYCLDSFVLPKIAFGPYSSPRLGVTLTLPAGWSLIETGSTESPLVFFVPHGQRAIIGRLYVVTVVSGTTAQQYIAGKARELGPSGSEKPFSFANSVTGYEYTTTLPFGGSAMKARIIALARGNLMYSLMFTGTASAMDAQAQAASQLARSLIVSSP